MPPLLIQPRLPWLAPLAGYSNLPFRLLCRSLGAAVACTEMVSAKGIYYSLYPDGNRQRPVRLPELDKINAQKGKGTWALLASPEEDSPLIVQLFGAEADIVQIAAESIIELFAGRKIYFDLNMGCSVPKVVKTGSGAAMLSDTNNALKVARALIAAAGPGRAGFKLRLGWLNGENVYLELAGELEAAGAGWITLHPRYGRQAFTGKADWSKTALLKQNLSIPVLASGDLLSAASAVQCLEQSGADAVMFARGAMNNPFIFREFRQMLQGEKPSPPSAEELAAVINHHARLARSWLDEGYALSQMRGFIPRYVHNFPGVRALRQQLTACRSWAQLDEIIATFIQGKELSGEQIWK